MIKEKFHLASLFPEVLIHYVNLSIPFSPSSGQIKRRVRCLLAFRLSEWSERGVHSSWMLRRIHWQLVTDVSGKPVSPIF